MRTTNLKTWLAISVFLLAIGSATAFADTIYVDDDATIGGNGQTWATAYKYLQDAIADANVSGDDIWVAEGTYKPDEDEGGNVDPNDRTETFQLINGVAIYGGFAGTESTLDERDWQTNETILSGDLNGDDVGFTNNGENSYHVVTGSGTDANAVLDGFTISGGNANGSGFDGCGGGMFNDSGSPTVRNCTFSGNSASSGGGIYCRNSSSTINNCTVTGNSAGSSAGIYCVYSSPLIINCNISYNSAEWGKGGLSIYSDSNAIVKNCVIKGNAAYSGAGLACSGDGSHVITNCIISDNYATIGHASIYCDETSVEITNCLISGNEVGGGNDYGAGIVTNESLVTISNSTFWGNSAGRGAGITCYNASDVAVTNCVLWGNEALEGPQIYLFRTIYPGLPKITISYSDVQGGKQAASVDPGCTLNWGKGNIDDDPCFVEPGNGDYRLLPDSPCIDAGNNMAVPEDISDLDGNGDTTERVPLDLDGNWRFVDFAPPGGTGVPDPPDYNNIVDMGAYEFVPPPIEVAMRFTPQALNPGSQGNWVKAHFVLPEGFLPEDVDANTPAILQPGDIPSEVPMNVFINEDGLVEVEAAFSRADFCSNGPTEGTVTVVGLLSSGQSFYGTDTIKIITHNLEYVAVLAVHWLEANCGKPDWCSGIDLDQNSVVDFVDFALFDGCCIEITK